MVTRIIIASNLRYINVELLCCTPETNIILYVNFNLKKKKDNHFQAKTIEMLSEICKEFRNIPQ